MRKKQLLWGLPVSLGLFLAFLPAFALSRGAGAGAGLWRHLGYGLIYSLHNPGAFLPLGLLCLVLGLLCSGLLARKEFGFRLPEFLLAIFFSENILIGLTEDRRIRKLIALPGLDAAENILLWTGLLAAVSAGIRLLVLLLQRPAAAAEEVPRSGRRMLLWAAITLVCWIPVILLRAPGGVMWDTNTQIQSFQGQVPVDASHPLLTTLIYGSLYTLGQRLWCDDLGIVLCVLVQGGLTLYSVAMLAEEATVCCRKKWAGFAVSLFFGLVNVFPMFVMTALRDSLFGPLYMLFALYYRRVLLDGGKKRDMVWLIVLGALCAATRKAAIYLVVLSMLGLLLYRKPLRRVLAAAALGLLAAHWAIIELLCPALNILPPADYENYSQFYYITGYYCQYHAQELSQEDIAVISDVLDYDAVLNAFNPDQNNSIKYTFHAESSEQIRRYVVLNLKFLLRHPLTVLEAIVYSRCNYFLPLYNESENIMGRIGDAWLRSPTADRLHAIQWDMNVSSPLRILNFSGLYNWLCLLLAVAALESRRREKLVLCLPALLMTLGLLTTHTNGAVRYALPVMYCVPMLLCLFRAPEKTQ